MNKIQAFSGFCVVSQAEQQFHHSPGFTGNCLERISSHQIAGRFDNNQN